MSLPAKLPEHITEESVEARLARVGSKIDDLIDKAHDARKHFEQKLEDLKRKEEVTLRKSEEAMQELKTSLDFAWEELNQAWKEVKLGTERAAKKLTSD